MKKIFIALAFLLYTTSAAFAAEVSLSMDPSVPEPYSPVVLKVSSYDIDVSTSMVVWKVKGTEIKRGLGEKSLSLTLGGVGTSVPVNVTVSDSMGNSFQAAMTVKPVGITLLWEAVESHTPPFYEGKPLPGPGAKIRVTSLADMGMPPSSLSYAWFEGETAIESASGAAKNSFISSLDILQDVTQIKSRVRSPDGAVAEKTIQITPHDIIPIFYPYDELMGTNLASPLLRRAELDKDVTLSFEPYYLSTRGLESTASYEWDLDGLPITPQEKTILSLHPKENSYGVRNLSVTADQAKRRMQKTEASLQVVFDTRH